MFFNGLGAIEIECDAPPYAVVQRCQPLGFRIPEDVRWCHTRNARRDPPKQRWGWFWKMLFRKLDPMNIVCSCGRDLPELSKHVFTVPPGEPVPLGLGQCPRCNTIFWKEL